jgi:hypothetical protein
MSQHSDDSEFVHKFSWISEPVDVRKECMMCLLYRNSPCESIYNQWEKVHDVEDKTKSETLKKQEDRLWDSVMECTKKNVNLLSDRQLEQKQYFQSHK